MVIRLRNEGSEGESLMNSVIIGEGAIRGMAKPSMRLPSSIYEIH